MRLRSALFRTGVILSGVTISFGVTRLAILYGRHVRDSYQSRGRSAFPTSLPDLSLELLGGSRINLKDLTGRPLVIIPVDLSVPAQVAALDRELQRDVPGSVRYLLVTSAPSRAAAMVIGRGDVMVSSEGDFNRFLAVFHMDRGTPSWLMFDRYGSLRGKGPYNSDSFGYFLRSVVTSDPDFTAAYLLSHIPEAVNRELMRAISGSPRPGKAAIVLLNHVSTTCPEYATLRALRDASSTDKLLVVAWLFEGMSTSDGLILRRNLDLPFRFERAGPEATAWWRDLAEHFSASAVNGSVILLESGAIVGAATGPAELQKTLGG